KDAEMAKAFDLYAQAIIDFGAQQGWRVLDTHHPLAEFYRATQRDDPAFVFTTYHSHLSPPGYMAWAFIQYGLLDPPAATSAVEITAGGKVVHATRCRISDIATRDGTLSFTRADEILPILPDVDLPMPEHAPLERHSRYLLTVTGLAAGGYDVLCDGA